MTTRVTRFMRLFVGVIAHFLAAIDHHIDVIVDVRFVWEWN